MREWLPLLDYRKLPAVSGLYVIRHAGGKQYVGQSKNVRKRMVGHLSGSNSGGYLPSAIRKHGAAAFEVCLWEALPISALGDAEVALIALLGTFAPAGYNASLGGLGPVGAVRDQAWLDRQSAQRRGVPLAPETIEKIRESALANNPFRGRKHTSEAKAKMAAAAVSLHTGLVRSAEARANISASLKGRAAPVLSAEARERVVTAQRKPNPKKALPGEANGMYGVKGGKHPASRPVIVSQPGKADQKFDSGTEAAQAFGVSPARICDWCKGRRKPPGNLNFSQKE